jgi:hypothetical protein
MGMGTKEKLIISLVLKDLGVEVSDRELAHKIHTAAIVVEALMAGNHESVKQLDPSRRLFVGETDA